MPKALVKSTKPKELKPNDPTAPRPKSCPKCKGRQIHAVEPVTASGLAVWRCKSCRAIGYGRRAVCDPTSGGDVGAQTAGGSYRRNLV